MEDEMRTRIEALAAIIDIAAPMAPEAVSLGAAHGRVLAVPIHARITQPPAAVSAMDGYAVRQCDANLGNSLRVIGEAPAGRPFTGALGLGEAVRIFTGSVVPRGADHVVIQEDTMRDGDQITVTASQPEPSNIRAAGIDFREGDLLLPAGRLLGAAELAIAAAANHAEVRAYPRPRIAVMANGDELRPPGSALAEGEIICSTPFALEALITSWGGEFVDLGIAPDDPAAIRARIQAADGVDVIIPLGGASVGDHDHMQAAFAEEGLEPVFSKVKLKPGKPTWFGKLHNTYVLGLPGNPASALVCAQLFLKPLIWQLTGRAGNDALVWRRARLTGPLEPPGSRETFLRGAAETEKDGRLTCTPAINQDSSLLRPFLTADLLIHRPANAPAAPEGSIVDCLMIR
ncbi:molybdopterin molybdotransferase MoeA [Hyphomonas neptunium]|nr:gephyrin-like molybdotransferase Glp [Hyphomonas neptunium]